MTDELNDLRGALDGMRTGVLKKLAGLSAEEARRSTVPSGTNLAGLVQHLTFVESRWFEEIVGRRSAIRGRAIDAGGSDGVPVHASRGLPGGVSRRATRSWTRIGDMDATVYRTGVGPTTCARRCLSVLGETARHAGHADIIREQIDGRTGR